MDRNEFAKRLNSIVIPEGTSEELINKMVLPISDALVQMMPQSLFRYRPLILMIKMFLKGRWMLSKTTK